MGCGVSLADFGLRAAGDGPATVTQPLHEPRKAHADNTHCTARQPPSETHETTREVTPTNPTTGVLLKNGRFGKRHLRQTPSGRSAVPIPAAAHREPGVDAKLLSEGSSKDATPPLGITPSVADSLENAQFVMEFATHAASAPSVAAATPTAIGAVSPSVTTSKFACDAAVVLEASPLQHRITPRILQALGTKEKLSKEITRDGVAAPLSPQSAQIVARATTNRDGLRPLTIYSSSSPCSPPPAATNTANAPLHLGNCSPNVDLGQALQAPGLGVRLSNPSSGSASRPASPDFSTLYVGSCFTGQENAHGVKPKTAAAASESVRPPLSSPLQHTKGSNAQVSYGKGSAFPNAYDMSMFSESRDSPLQRKLSTNQSTTFSNPFIAAMPSEGSIVCADSILNCFLPTLQPPLPGQTNTRDSLQALTVGRSSPCLPPRLPSAFVGLVDSPSSSFVRRSTEIHDVHRNDDSADVLSSWVPRSSPQMDASVNKSTNGVLKGAASGDEAPELVPMERRTKAVNKSAEKAEKSGDDDSQGGGLVRSSSNVSDIITGSTMSLLAAVKARRRTVTIVEPVGRPAPLQRPTPIPAPRSAGSAKASPSLTSPLNRRFSLHSPTAHGLGSPQVTANKLPSQQQQSMFINGVHYHQPPPVMRSVVKTMPLINTTATITTSPHGAPVAHAKTPLQRGNNVPLGRANLTCGGRTTSTASTMTRLPKAV
jgi:hypothetical protein